MFFSRFLPAESSLFRNNKHMKMRKCYYPGKSRLLFAACSFQLIPLLREVRHTRLKQLQILLAADILLHQVSPALCVGHFAKDAAVRT